jgi:hypothetical protein
MENELMVVEQEERSVDVVKAQVYKVQALMRELMHEGEHYGVIPGTGKKPTLYKAGAEKLCFTFKLAPEFEVIPAALEASHREYSVKCRLRSMGNQQIVGEGVGSCSTMESKYRYRKDRNGNRIENADIADVYNTVLKMAKKRAFVDATITATAASDIFTQDVEDMADDEPRNVTPAPSPLAQQCTNAAASLGLSNGDKDAMFKKHKGDLKAVLGELKQMIASEAEPEKEIY